MKKIFALVIMMYAFLVVTLAAQNTNPYTMKVAWTGSPDANVVAYSLYYKNVSATSFSSINLVGAATTNAAIGVTPGVIYELYVIAKDANEVESDPSNKIHGQNILVNGFGKPTFITLLDAGTTNFSSFVLSSGSSSNGIVSGTPPNITYTATNIVGKDMMVYKSPETFSGQFVTNYYGLFRAIRNAPIITVPWYEETI